MAGAGTFHQSFRRTASMIATYRGAVPIAFPTAQWECLGFPKPSGRCTLSIKTGT